MVANVNEYAVKCIEGVGPANISTIQMRMKLYTYRTGWCRGVRFKSVSHCCGIQSPFCTLRQSSCAADSVGTKLLD